MPILNYTTEVEATRTVGEIQAILGSKGAREITVRYGADGKAEAIGFALEIQGQAYHFRLPRNIDGVLAALRKDATDPEIKRKMDSSKVKLTPEHAERVTWRILKDWVEAQMALVEADQAKMAEAFLPYMVDERGQTMFQRFEKSLPQLQEKNENTEPHA